VDFLGAACKRAVGEPGRGDLRQPEQGQGIAAAESR
jgi:hypothetical protein